MLIFFIAGLLYLLCFEHVDNLGAYSIPSETGLLIPSGYNSYFRFAHDSGITFYKSACQSEGRSCSEKGVFGMTRCITDRAPMLTI